MPSDYVRMNGNSVAGFTGVTGMQVNASTGFAYQSNCYTAGVLFSTVRALSRSGYHAIRTAAERYFISEIGKKTIAHLVGRGAVLSIDETSIAYYGPGFAETGRNRIHLNPGQVSKNSFATPNTNWFAEKTYEPITLDTVIAHEVRHATYGERDEKTTVDDYENPYRLSQENYPQRGEYLDWIGPNGLHRKP